MRKLFVKWAYWAEQPRTLLGLLNTIPLAHSLVLMVYLKLTKIRQINGVYFLSIITLGWQFFYYNYVSIILKRVKINSYPKTPKYLLIFFLFYSFIYGNCTVIKMKYCILLILGFTIHLKPFKFVFQNLS